MKTALVVISLVFLAAGAYLQFFYDVPDGLEATNLVLSIFLMVVGAGGLLVTLLWKTPRGKGTRGGRP